ncbi:MAG: 3'(2'),5'-bisphosphate nucleotidase CysQ [Thermodesulfobacteriota bacterium]|nr:3'(2'),5'-bisphosphate nucleotidase CysQ [Thermodesulfobacteriota bacterium]
MIDDRSFIDALSACVAAGRAALNIYDTDFEVEHKADESPLTLADKRSHEIITSALAASNIPILSEEGKTLPFDARRDWHRLWIVDPLDGTKEFVKRNGEFTINIALVENGTPVFGVIYVPVKNTLYFGSDERGAYKITDPSVLSAMADNHITDLSVVMEKTVKLPVDRTGDKQIKIVGSRSHLTPEVEAYVEKMKAQYGDVDFVAAGSSLKICLVAEGAADIYPRLGPTMEWDIAAGHAIAKSAGAKFYCYETGEAMTYNREDLLNPWFVVERPGFYGTTE